MHDPQGSPVVIDWRAPVSRPFYRASQGESMGLERRRRFGFAGGELTAFEDEEFGGGGSDLGTASRILIDEIERPRSGPMRDIVATIQPDQDDIVRAGVEQTVCVQGAPGTGKTAVGLHRVAYLLYAHAQRLSRGGVLVVGPNEAFLAYIQNVLPALGELDVAQLSVAELLATVPVRGADTEAAARIKGDARMAEVLRRALWAQVTEPAEAIMLVRGSRRWRVPAYEVGELIAELQGPRRPVRHRQADARAPDRARHPHQDGGGRRDVRRPHARGGAADPAGAGGGRPGLAEDRPGPAGPAGARRTGPAGARGRRDPGARPSRRR